MVFPGLRQEVKNINRHILTTEAKINKHRGEKLALTFFYLIFAQGSSGIVVTKNAFAENTGNDKSLEQ